MNFHEEVVHELNNAWKILESQEYQIHEPYSSWTFNFNSLTHSSWTKKYMNNQCYAWIWQSWKYLHAPYSWNMLFMNYLSLWICYVWTWICMNICMCIIVHALYSILRGVCVCLCMWVCVCECFSVCMCVCVMHIT